MPTAITPLGFPEDDGWACDDDLLDEPVCGVGLAKIPAKACGGKCAPPSLVDVMAIPETFGARLLSQRSARIASLGEVRGGESLWAGSPVGLG